MSRPQRVISLFEDVRLSEYTCKVSSLLAIITMWVYDEGLLLNMQAIISLSIRHNIRRISP